MWGYLPTPVDGVRKDNVLFATWYDGLAPMEGDATPSAKEFDALLALREQVAKVLEPMRAGGEIGAALEAEIALKCGVSEQNWLAPLVDELQFPLINGDGSLEDVDDEQQLHGLASETKQAKGERRGHQPGRR